MQETQVQSLYWEDPLEREWQPTPVFLPRELHGQKSLVGYSPWDCIEFMGSQSRIRLSVSLSLFSLMHWRRKWQPTPVFLPGEFQGRGSLVGCRL